MDEMKCKHGMVPEKCPVALGIYVDGILYDDEGKEKEIISKWQAVCDQVDGACAKDLGIEEWAEEA